jgi:hypothetical protein
MLGLTEAEAATWKGRVFLPGTPDFPAPIYRFREPTVGDGLLDYSEYALVDRDTLVIQGYPHPASGDVHGVSCAYIGNGYPKPQGVVNSRLDQTNCRTFSNLDQGDLGGYFDDLYPALRAGRRSKKPNRFIAHMLLFPVTDMHLIEFIDKIIRLPWLKGNALTPSVSQSSAVPAAAGAGSGSGPRGGGRGGSSGCGNGSGDGSESGSSKTDAVTNSSGPASSSSWSCGSGEGRGNSSSDGASASIDAAGAAPTDPRIAEPPENVGLDPDSEEESTMDAEGGTMCLVGVSVGIDSEKPLMKWKVLETPLSDEQLSNLTRAVPYEIGLSTQFFLKILLYFAYKEIRWYHYRQGFLEKRLQFRDVIKTRDSALKTYTVLRFFEDQPSLSVEYLGKVVQLIEDIDELYHFSEEYAVVNVGKLLDNVGFIRVVLRGVSRLSLCGIVQLWGSTIQGYQRALCGVACLSIVNESLCKPPPTAPTGCNDLCWRLANALYEYQLLCPTAYMNEFSNVLAEWKRCGYEALGSKIVLELRVMDIISRILGPSHSLLDEYCDAPEEQDYC